VKIGDRIGLFGGSFDPIHTGHLILAQMALDYANLDKVYFIPTAVPPHKKTRKLTAIEHRMKMVELAIADNDGFEISLLEKKTEPSFTFESVLHFSSFGYDRAGIHLLVGSDSLGEMSTWREPDTIFRNATILAMKRPGHEIPAGVPREASVIMMTTGTNSISSSSIRDMVLKGRSVRYLVPRPVEEYIKANSLYAASE